MCRGHFLELPVDQKDYHRSPPEEYLPVDQKDYHRSHPEKCSGHFLKSPVDEEMRRKVHPMINSIQRDRRIAKGEVNEVRETPGWERIRVQIDSGAIDAVGRRNSQKLVK